MRRNEFEITDQREIRSFLEGNAAGILSLTDKKNLPYSVPLNYVLINDTIYFHCAHEGEKINAINYCKNAQFTVFREYSFIPSYSTGNRTPCSATAFFKSVFISGKVEPVDSNEEKALVMNSFMKSFQPEGGFAALEAGPHSVKILDAVTVYKITAKKISAKFKFGQQLGKESRHMIVDMLEKRGTPLDIETVSEMKRFYPGT